MFNPNFEQHIMKNPKLPFIFHMDYATRGIPKITNWHKNTEFLYCVSGSGIVKYDTKEYQMKKGDLFFIESFKLHSTSTENDNFVFYYLIVDDDFCEENGINWKKISLPTIISDSIIGSKFKNIIKSFLSSDLFSETRIRLNILDFMTFLCENYSEYHNEIMDDESVMENRIRKTITYLKINFDRKLTLDEIANYVGINKCYLSREFKKHTGQSLFKYINVLKCTEASKLIQKGQSISSAAMTCGFDNMSYFTRTYKAVFNCTPTQFIQLQNNKRH